MSTGIGVSDAEYFIETSASSAPASRAGCFMPWPAFDHLHLNRRCGCVPCGLATLCPPVWNFRCGRGLAGDEGTLALQGCTVESSSHMRRNPRQQNSSSDTPAGKAKSSSSEQTPHKENLMSVQA